jgi:hypothetical protein
MIFGTFLGCNHCVIMSCGKSAASAGRGNAKPKIYGPANLESFGDLALRAIRGFFPSEDIAGFSFLDKGFGEGIRTLGDEFLDERLSHGFLGLTVGITRLAGFPKFQISERPSLSRCAGSRAAAAFRWL